MKPKTIMLLAATVIVALLLLKAAALALPLFLKLAICLLLPAGAIFVVFGKQALAIMAIPLLFTYFFTSLAFNLGATVLILLLSAARYHKQSTAA